MCGGGEGRGQLGLLRGSDMVKDSMGDPGMHLAVRARYGYILFRVMGKSGFPGEGRLGG